MIGFSGHLSPFFINCGVPVLPQYDIGSGGSLRINIVFSTAQ